MSVHDIAIDPDTGLAQAARQCPSPNCDAWPDGSLPELIVVHGISLPPGEFGGGWIDALFTKSLAENLATKCAMPVREAVHQDSAEASRIYIAPGGKQMRLVIVVHPPPGNWSGTLVNALLHHFQTSGGTISTIGGKERPGLVHRLDKETSGVMVITKTDTAHRALAAQFKLHTITRVYEALVWGVPKRDEE